MNKIAPVGVAVVGAGSRGFSYARIARKYPDLFEIQAVADPDPAARDRFAAEMSLSPQQCHDGWQSLADSGFIPEAVFICTQDALHRESTIPFLEHNRHVLLEKPIAPTWEDCLAIAHHAEQSTGVLAVCHVLRYTDYTREILRIIRSGILGDLVTIQHLEPVNWWHQAHSFVRGNWRRSDLACPMILAKCCHDLDWLLAVMDQPWVEVSSFGSLFHFRAEHRPPGAADRCLDCEIESRCPYSALQIYLRDHLEKGLLQWPLDVVTPDFTQESLLQALRDGPYGRCVYACDNDVVDHQVVNIQLANGASVSHTMTAFTPPWGRLTRICGTHGFLEGDSQRIRVLNYKDGWQPEVDVNTLEGTIAGGHGGGDERMLLAFAEAVRNHRPEAIQTGIHKSLASHSLAFAAELARRESRVVRAAEFAI